MSSLHLRWPLLIPLVIAVSEQQQRSCCRCFHRVADTISEQQRLCCRRCRYLTVVVVSEQQLLCCGCSGTDTAKGARYSYPSSSSTTAAAAAASTSSPSTCLGAAAAVVLLPRRHRIRAAAVFALLLLLPPRRHRRIHIRAAAAVVLLLLLPSRRCRIRAAAGGILLLLLPPHRRHRIIIFPMEWLPISLTSSETSSTSKVKDAETRTACPSQSYQFQVTPKCDQPWLNAVQRSTFSAQRSAVATVFTHPTPVPAPLTQTTTTAAAASSKKHEDEQQQQLAASILLLLRNHDEEWEQQHDRCRINTMRMRTNRSTTAATSISRGRRHAAARPTMLPAQHAIEHDDRHRADVSFTSPQAMSQRHSASPTQPTRVSLRTPACASSTPHPPR
ncbi:hypothetical protein BDZ97DRAFT_1920073 [Flammula alnicola]|nr:hypothetical protein BDZ97DRAFT_1920073 [Flammula alnicola]